MDGYRTRRGEEAPNAKLNRALISEIRRRRAEGETYQQIADELGVARNTVRNAEQGASYHAEWG